MGTPGPPQISLFNTNESNNVQPPSQYGPPSRLPTYLLSASRASTHSVPGFSGTSHTPTSLPSHAPSPFTSYPPSPSIAFNDRLQTSITPTSPVPAPLRTTTPRLPPSKSLLDAGTPAVLSLHPPPLTPPTRSYSTPYSASPSNQNPLSSATGSTPLNSLPMYQGNQSNHESACITVFGFPPSSQALITREFRRHGDILRVVPTQGNWLHILYRSPLHAQVALYRPWRILPGTQIMIGVVPCTDPSVAVEDPRRSDIASGTLVSSPAPIVSGGVHGSVTPHRQMLRRSVGGDGAGVREEEGREGALGLRTPASVLHRDVDMDGVDGGRRAGHTDPNSIIRTPQRQKGFFDYLAATFSN